MLAAAVIVASAIAPRAGAASWRAAVRLAGPVDLDATPFELAFSPGGQAAVGLGFVDSDRPAGSRASVALIGQAGTPIRTRAVPHTRQVLDVLWTGGSLQVLGGTSGGGLTCCTQIQTLTLGAHGFGAPRSLIRGLSGLSVGRLVASGTGSEAVFGAWNGVWAARAPRSGRYGAVHRLTATSASPQSLLAAPLHGGGTLVAFAQTPLRAGTSPDSPAVMVSRGGATRLPPRPRTVQTFPTGTAIGPLALAPNPFAPALGWAEDAGDATGANSSEIVLATLGSPPLHPRTYSVSGQTASGLSGGADSSGDELFAWESCDAVPVCHVLAVSRGAHGRFGTARTLGTIDASAEPAVAVGARGAAVVGWVQDGHIEVVRRDSSARRFSAPARLAGPGPASQLKLAAGPSGRMLAVWAAGTRTTTIWASELR